MSACGNGIVGGTERCDDGNAVNGDGCDNNCKLSGCGDGIKAGAEACDDGNFISGDGCDDNCTVSACGNGITAGAERCDDGNSTNGDGCESDCTITGCGNGIVAGAEQCDDGNLVNGDGCDNNCTVSACGNGIMGGAETCDDGNLVNGDGCDANCTQTGCGNGIVTAAEQCDDGNAVSGDGCDNNCTPTACGNGIVTGSEQCDDRNTAGGDGCDARCAYEPGTPGQCALVRAQWEALLSGPHPMCAHLDDSLLPPGAAPRDITSAYVVILPELADVYTGEFMRQTFEASSWSYVNPCGPKGPELAITSYFPFFISGQTDFQVFVMSVLYLTDPEQPVNAARPWTVKSVPPGAKILQSNFPFDDSNLRDFVLAKYAPAAVATSDPFYCRGASLP